MDRAARLMQVRMPIRYRRTLGDASGALDMEPADALLTLIRCLPQLDEDELRGLFAAAGPLASSDRVFQVSVKVPSDIGDGILGGRAGVSRMASMALEAYQQGIIFHNPEGCD